MMRPIAPAVVAAALTIAVCVCGAVSAEEPPQDASQAMSDARHASAPAALIPAAQSCTAFYPEISVQQHDQGEVTVGYDIAADGGTHNLAILKSSGVGRLDEAALACAGAWHLPPERKDGVAIYSTGHQATIRFRLHDPVPPDFAARWPRGTSPQQPADPSITPSRPIGRTHDCSSYYPDEARRAGQTGEVEIGYDVGADAVLGNIRLITSSGYDLLDQAALACVRERWRNEPATKDGQPIASPGHHAVIQFQVF